MDDKDKKILEAYQRTVLQEGKKIVASAYFDGNVLKWRTKDGRTGSDPMKKTTDKKMVIKHLEKVLGGKVDLDMIKENLDTNQRIQEAYIETILNERRSRVRGKKTPWRALKKRLKRLKGKFKRKKAKKTKEAFNAKLFKKKGKRIKDIFRKTLKKIMREHNEAITEGDWAESYNEKYEPRILALAQNLNIDPAEIEQESYGGYSAEGGEYEVLTDSEADERTREYIEESVWAFNTWFIENFIDVEDANRYFGFEDSYYDEDEEEEVEIGDDDEVFYMGMGMDLTEYIESQQQQAESGNDALVSLINASAGMDRFVEDAIAADGRGHFLNHYDGEEHEEQVNGSWYYIYQTN